MTREPIERRARVSRSGPRPTPAELAQAGVDAANTDSANADAGSSVANERSDQDALAAESDAAMDAGDTRRSQRTRRAGDAVVQLAARELGAASQTTGLALAALIESILFVADRPVAVSELAKVLEVPKPMVERALGDLAPALTGRGVRLARRNGTVQMVSAPEAAPVVQRFLGLSQDGRLSRPALETLSIIAYRQPLTRPEMEALRGVSCDGVLRTLLAREFIESVGRRATVGNPVEYGTTFQFLAYFGLSSVADLPPIEAFGGSDPAISEDDGAQDPVVL
ncbi:MAG: SMC-Scp complex subunit ScpB [Ardenticatenales bacterium]